MDKFNNDHAMQVINEMRICYGKKFSDQWSGIRPSELASKMVEIFSDLNPNDLLRGFQKMQTQAWPPTLPEFKSWCLGDMRSQWLGANEAWNIAKSSIDFNGNELTVIWTKECAIAFDAVSDQVKLGDKYQISDAKKVFVEMYERMVSESLERGEKPLYSISYGDNKEQRKTALKEAEIAGYLPTGESDKLIPMIQSPSDARNEDAKFKTLAQEQLAKLKGLLKANNPINHTDAKSVEVVLFNTVGNLSEWADPFDQQEEYRAGLKNDGKPMPCAIGN